MTSSRHSPPTERVVAVLDHLAASPGKRLGLSELARSLGISKPTCLGILTTLTDSGYLVCDPASKTYRLGPALMALGKRAAEDFDAADIAGRRLAELANRYAATGAASAVVGEQIVLLAVTPPTGHQTGVTVGQRYPFAPPVGLMYVLWDGDESFEKWLARPATLPVTLDRDHLRAVVADCRDRGYLVEGLTETGRRLYSVMAGVAAYDLPPEVRELVGEMASSLGERVYLGSDMSARGRYPVSVIAAPTYDADGRQDLVLTLDVRGTLTGAEITRRGRALVAVADAVTAEAGGRRPDREGPTI